MVTKLVGPSSSMTSVLSVVGGTVIGAVLGAVSKTNNGALIGGGVGAGAGTGIALLRKGKDVRIRTGEEFEIELKREVLLPGFGLLKILREFGRWRDPFGHTRKSPMRRGERIGLFLFRFIGPRWLRQPNRSPDVCIHSRTF